MKTELLIQFQGRSNVRHIVNDNGVDAWLTQEISFGGETVAKGACKLNTVENETKHILFFSTKMTKKLEDNIICKRLQ